MRPLPRIPIVEEYLRYQAGRGVFAERTLQRWRWTISRTSLDNGGFEGLISTPVEQLNFGAIVSGSASERRGIIRDFKDWYLRQNVGVPA